MHIFSMARFTRLGTLALLRCGRTVVRGVLTGRLPPGENMDDLSTIFKSGMWRLFYKLSNEGRKRFFNEFFPLLHDTKFAHLQLC
jgi:hypothetical protein